MNQEGDLTDEDYEEGDDLLEEIFRQPVTEELRVKGLSAINTI
jgi:hypothetical protein